MDIKEYQEGKWYLNVWRLTNVLPSVNRLEEGIAAFPDEIAYRLIKLFSYAGETVLEPFVGSGTTIRMARQLGRNSIGYEIDVELVSVIKQKVGYDIRSLGEEVEFEFIIRDDAQRLRSDLQQKVRMRKSVATTTPRNKAKNI